MAGNGFVAPVTTNYAFDPANRLTSDGTKTYAWDANGNMTGDGSRTFTFDSANRMRQLVVGANTYTYGYDGNGNRMSSAVNGGTAIHFQNDNAGLSQVLSDGTNLYIPGLVQSNADGTNAQYFLQDALGSNVMLADATANWTVLPQYDPFGNSAPTSLTNFGYTGEQKDASGLEFLRARYYDPNLGIFISKDPESKNMNGYNYANNNPVMASDPSGRDPGECMPYVTGAVDGDVSGVTELVGIGCVIYESAVTYGPQVGAFITQNGPAMTAGLQSMLYQSSHQFTPGEINSMIMGNLAEAGNPMGEMGVLSAEGNAIAQSGMPQEVENAIKDCNAFGYFTPEDWDVLSVLEEKYGATDVHQIDTATFWRKWYESGYGKESLTYEEMNNIENGILYHDTGKPLAPPKFFTAKPKEFFADPEMVKIKVSHAFDGSALNVTTGKYAQYSDADILNMFHHSDADELLNMGAITSKQRNMLLDFQLMDNVDAIRGVRDYNPALKKMTFDELMDKEIGARGGVIDNNALYWYMHDEVMLSPDKMNFLKGIMGMK